MSLRDVLKRQAELHRVRVAQERDAADVEDRLARMSEPEQALAAGAALDALALTGFNVHRKDNETDHNFRSRLIALLTPP